MYIKHARNSSPFSVVEKILPTGDGLFVFERMGG